MKKLIGTDFRPAKPWGWLIGLAALINRFRLRRRWMSWSLCGG